MSIQQQLIDATQYELIETIANVFEWQEQGQSLGIELRVSNVSGTTLISVYSQETKGYVMLTLSEIERDLKVAIDVMQFAEYWDQEEWPFSELSAAANACNLDYGFVGSGMGLSIAVGRGGWLDKTDDGYVIYDGNGLSYNAGTIAGLKKAYRSFIISTDNIAKAEATLALKKLSELQK